MTRRWFLGAAASSAVGADSVVPQWRRIAARVGGTVGAAAADLANGHVTSLNGGISFPLASVCKLPIAVAILAMVLEGKLSLTSEIEVPVYDVVPFVSPIAARWPHQRRFPLDEMLALMISQSDNTAVQTLFRQAGDGPGMAARLRKWGIEGMRVDRSERECGWAAAGVRSIPPVQEWTPELAGRLEAAIPASERLAAMRRFLSDPRDTATPNATVELLRKLFGGQLLSPALTARLIAMMEKTSTGPARMKGLLPVGTLVAHKTGTTGSAGSLNGSTNDVGVIAGKLALAVYIKGSTRPLAERERVIAEIARTVFPG